MFTDFLISSSEARGSETDNFLQCFREIKIELVQALLSREAQRKTLFRRFTHLFTFANIVIMRAFRLAVRLMLYHAETETPKTVFHYFVPVVKGVLRYRSLSHVFEVKQSYTQDHLRN